MDGWARLGFAECMEPSYLWMDRREYLSQVSV